MRWSLALKRFGDKLGKEPGQEKGDRLSSAIPEDPRSSRRSPEIQPEASRLEGRVGGDTKPKALTDPQTRHRYVWGDCCSH